MLMKLIPNGAKVIPFLLCSQVVDYLIVTFEVLAEILVAVRYIPDQNAT
jgi:hypothetical protein